jgi:dynein heavy chain
LLDKRQRLAITPLSDRCLVSLMLAIKLNMVGGLVGPAGVGKSESVRDLAKTLGQSCILFNCSD